MTFVCRKSFIGDFKTRHKTHHYGALGVSGIAEPIDQTVHSLDFPRCVIMCRVSQLNRLCVINSCLGALMSLTFLAYAGGAAEGRSQRQPDSCPCADRK